MVDIDAIFCLNEQLVVGHSKWDRKKKDMDNFPRKKNQSQEKYWTSALKTEKCHTTQKWELEIRKTLILPLQEVNKQMIRRGNLDQLELRQL